MSSVTGQSRRAERAVLVVIAALILLRPYGVVGAGFWLSGDVSRISSAWPYGFGDRSAFVSVLILVTNVMSEDVDYCLRVLAAGLRTQVVPVARVSHKSGRSLGAERSPVREYLIMGDWYLLWRTHLSGWQRRTYPRRYLARALNRVLNAQREGDDAVLAEHALDGIWDGLRGHWGPWLGKGRMPTALRRFVTRGLLAWHPCFWLLLLSGNAGMGRTESKPFGLRRASPDETP